MAYSKARPVLLVDTKNLQLTVNGKKQFTVTGEPILDEKEWLKWRRNGIGGSDAAAVTGNSPWKSRQELADDKRGVIPAFEKTFNSHSKEIGHMTENHVRSQMLPYILQKSYGLKNFQIGTDTRMCRHGNPEYSMVLADIDGWIKLEDGTVGIVEIKTTSRRNKATIDKWLAGIVPAYYEDQCRHYMAVMNLDFCYICCAWGFDPDTECVVIRIGRDMKREEALMDAEKAFWEDHVVKGIPVKEEDCDPSIVRSYLGRKMVPVENKKAVSVDGNAIETILDLEQRIADLQAQLEALKKEKDDKETSIILNMNGNSYGECLNKAGAGYKVYVKEKFGKASYDVDSVKANFPEIYEKAHKDSIIATKLTASDKTAIKAFKIEGEAKGELAVSIYKVEAKKAAS